MQRDIVIKGRGLGGSSDLTLLAPIKPGFIDSLESVTYKTRIKRVLETLHGARTASHEYSTARLLSDSVERVGAIHAVRVAVLEPEDKVLLAVTFDGSWESYIRVLWDKVGTLLDLIFCGTEDYVTAFDHTFDEWLVWARRVQVKSGFFYGPPDSTARDALYQRRVERMRIRGAGAGSAESELNEIRAVLPSAEEAVQRLVTGAARVPDDPPTPYPGDVRMVRERIRNGLQSLAGLYRLADLHRPSTNDGTVLRRAAVQLLMEFVQMHDAKLIRTQLAEARDRFARQLDWLFPDGEAPAALVRLIPLEAFKRGKVEDAVRADIQGGILRPYEKTTHGLVLLLAFEDAQTAHAFLADIDGRITSDHDPDSAPPGSVVRNFALTPAGLRAVGLSEDELELFPEEFRQSMQARAGLLGDVHNNHPRRWRLPRRFAGLGTKSSPDETIELDTVHAVLQLRCEAQTPSALAAIEYTDANHPLRGEVTRLTTAIPNLRVLAIQSLRRNFREQSGEQVVVEHFGFADGNGQPDVEPGKFPFDRNRINLGEIVQGHDNAVDFKIDPDDPAVPERAKARLRWLVNGSFLVMRKYRQFVSRMERAVAVTANEMQAKLGGKAEDYIDVVYGKLMGRIPAGFPVAAPDVVDPDKVNLFDYEDDKQGQLCPLHAHIRRANQRMDPAGAGRIPRLMRRSMSYGPPRDPSEGDKDAERGLVFMAYNADLGEQFEVVQRWLVDGNSTGSSSAESCPIVGVPENGLQRYFRFEYPDPDPAVKAHVFRVELEGNVRLFEEPHVLTQLEWGMYLFTPSLSVLRRLRTVAATKAAVAPAQSVPWEIKRGRTLLAALKQLEVEEGESSALAAWKAAIEDPESIDRLDSAAIWAAIREYHGGLLKTPYGILVADRDLLSLVLLNSDARYSVCGQFDRMKRSFGEISLGMDDGPVYRQQSGPINAAIGTLNIEDVFDLARDAANEKIDAIIAEAKRQSNDVGDTRFEVGFEAREVSDQVLAMLCEEWFGLKDGQYFRRGSADWGWRRGQPPLYPGHFTALSRYMFQPNPGPTAIELGQHYGQALREAMNQFVAFHRAAGTTPTKRDGTTPAPIALATFNHPTHGADNDFVARNMVGVLMGFNPTIIGAVLNVLREWQSDGSFWSLRSTLAGATDFAKAHVVLGGAMAAAARMRPMPQIGWRTALKPHRLGPEGAGAVDVAAGEKLVLANVSGTQQSLADGKDDGRLMFGGVRSNTPHPTHACPGYAAGIGAMLGALTALLARPENLRQGVAPLTFVIEGLSGYVSLPLPAKSTKSPVQVAAQLESLQLQEISGAALVPPIRTGRVLGWGDSWLDYRLPFGLGDLGTDLRDCLEERKYSMPKDFCDWTTYTKAEGMAANPTLFCNFLVNELQLRNPRAILLSGGGNDSTEGSMKALILPKGSGAPTILDPGALAAHIGSLRTYYVTMLAAIKEVFDRPRSRTLPVLVHGYDYPIPAGRAGIRKWLYDPFKSKGYNCSVAADLDLARRGMRELIDAFNTMLSQLNAPPFTFVVYVKLSGTIEGNWPTDPGQGWANDLHPTDPAFELLAAKLDNAIQQLP